MAQQKIAVIGSGWGGYLFSKYVNRSLYNVNIISPRNHFIFTPMLPAAAVGTLEYNVIQESVRCIPKVDYLQASAESLNLENKTVHCKDVYKGNEFDVNYDYLVIAAGGTTQTFNTPGAEHGKNNCFFLKELTHAREIRARCIECFEQASYPGVSDEEKRKLLSFVLVGAGPINVEFGGQLFDYLHHDVCAVFPDLRDFVCVRIIEAGENVLGPYSPALQEYAENLIRKRTCYQLTLGTAVKEVREGVVELSNGDVIPCGFVVWSTGVKPVPFINSLQAYPKDFQFWNGRLLVDDNFRCIRPGDAMAKESFLQPHKDIFALGDCAVTMSLPLPQLGQVAKKQAKHLAANFNKKQQETATKPFKFSTLLQLRDVGEGEVVMDTNPDVQAGGSITTNGWKARMIWKAAYWGIQVSKINRILIPFYRYKARVFGRDTSKF